MAWGKPGAGGSLEEVLKNKNDPHVTGRSYKVIGLDLLALSVPYLLYI